MNGLDLPLIISVFSFLVSLISCLIAYLSWHKNRAIYDIEKWYLRPDGIQQIKEKLNSGKYTILNSYQDEARNTTLILGKIKR